ncbi:MAG: GNAT family N-acetyltransferase [Myxococcus sp.]|nr:GNAT family N-acetyltransferase [Myxococcus sp.]
MSEPAFLWLPFDRLTPRQVHDVLQLRQRVFVVEQRCPYLDADGLDPKCWHGLGTRADGTLVATARLVPPGVVYEEPAIGRVASAPDVRRRGFGRQLMNEAVREVRRLYPGQGIRIGAQRYLEKFYGSLGFVPVGEPYLEDDIPHIHMLRPW